MADELKTFREKLSALGAQRPYFARAFGLVWHAAGGWTAAWLVLLAAQGLLPVATVYLTKHVVDSLVAALGGGTAWENVRPTFLLAAALGGVLLLAEVLRSLNAWVRAVQAERVRDHMSALIHRKSIAADLAFYEWPDYFDRLHRARDQAATRPLALLEALGSLLQNGITLVAMMGVLLPYGWWLPAALVLSTLPALYVVLQFALRQHAWRVRATPDERRLWYYDWLLSGPEPAAELRAFGLGEKFQAAFRGLRDRLRSERLDLVRRQSLAEMAAGAFALLLSGATLLWMAGRAFSGLLTLGDLALLFQAFNQGLGLLRSLLQNVGQVFSNSLFLADLFEFLALEPRVTSPPAGLLPPRPLREGIAFHRVTFRYPGSSAPALREFSLSIPAGQIAAVVGPNGAGKSTLIKLLCRLYDPDSGAVELDGMDLRQMPLEELRRMISVLFQQPMHYFASVAENISLSNPQAGPAEIQTAAAAAGADAVVARLPEGYAAQLGKWFRGGTELSVGEWQRVALARAFCRPAPVFVLDEPTSAMDSWAEAEWAERLRSLAAGRTVLLITHRFTTAMHADVIHVVSDGQVVESGSHRELLANGGLYAQSWASQMSR
jgi:ATP-binding cassette subfamily B protein